MWPSDVVLDRRELKLWPRGGKYCRQLFLPTWHLCLTDVVCEFTILLLSVWWSFFFPSLTPFRGLFWPSLLTGEFLKVFSAAPLATPTAAQLGIFWSRQPPLKTPSDCHHLQTPSGRLVQGIWLDYQLRVDCRLSLGDCVALRLSQVPLASNISAAAADKNIFFFFNDFISFKTNSTRWNQLPTWRDGGGGTRLFASACLCGIGEKSSDHTRVPWQEQTHGAAPLLLIISNCCSFLPPADSSTEAK